MKRKLTGIWIIIAVCIMLGMCSCKSIQYIPIETVRTEIVHQTDTVKQSDSSKTEKQTIIREARPEDSLMLARLGIRLQDNERLLILLQKELTETKRQLSSTHSKDSVRTDSIPVPYPVPAQLTRWQTFCCDYGRLMLGATCISIFLTIIIVIRFLKKARLRRES